MLGINAQSPRELLSLLHFYDHYGIKTTIFLGKKIKKGARLNFSLPTQKNRCRLRPLQMW
jgi:hypothetical protein